MVSAITLVGALVAATAVDGAPLAQMRLYNPTTWDGAAWVEVPTGRLASPGLIDWGHVRLVLDGREVPFAIREGRPHWRAALAAPVPTPRAEDLLVFSCAVPPAAWATLSVVRGTPDRASHLSRIGQDLLITYDAVRVRIRAESGLLQSVTTGGGKPIAGPLTAQAFVVAQTDGAPRTPLDTPMVRLVSSLSTGALTELSFERATADGLHTAVTYRVQSCGRVEIIADERPWEGRSPWVGHAVEYRLPIAGDAEPLPYLANRAPYYGFRDFDAAVKHPAFIHRAGLVSVVELGEETTNGRRWRRQLHIAPCARRAQADALAELADEGLVIDVTPRTASLGPGPIRVSAPPEARVPAEVLADALRARGVEAAVAGPPAAAQVALRIATQADAPGISGDGFAIEPRGGGVTITALTPFGLTQGAQRLAEYLADATGGVRAPLIAENPASNLRAGGFGGGEHEVDFPYGTDDEWEHALGGMIASGMNTMADLSMWGNWKMPVTYRYMPELQSNSPDAIDPASGARFSEIPAHRERGLRLLDYLHRRGVKVWQWIPVGCVPSTFATAHPEAMSKTNPGVPCFTDPSYACYLEAYARELLETYPIDGIVMIRDDNGGICQCDRCQAYVDASRTRNAMWEQHILLYGQVRSLGFAGDIAVYPYMDPYQPELDALLPADLYIVGHGSGAGMLSRSLDTLGPMGDTWLDNLFASFRPPSIPRMKRLLADRGSFWIGGAYCGTELQWEAIGYFSWEPTATVNTFRYAWGARSFGERNALPFLELADVYDDLLDIYDLHLLPQEWVKLSDHDRAQVAHAARRRLGDYAEHLAALESSVRSRGGAKWFAHMRLFATYFDYLLRRLEALSAMESLVLAHRDAPELPADARARLIAMRDEVCRLADDLDAEAATVPGNMLAATRRAGLLKPFREWVAGYDAVEWSLEVKQFSGMVSAAAPKASAGQPFALAVELRNTGIWPWVEGAGQTLELGGDATRVGLPAKWDFAGPPMVYGDRRVVELNGVAPLEPGQAEITVSLRGPFRSGIPFASQTVKVEWR